MPDPIPAQFELASTLHILRRHTEEIEALDLVLARAPNHPQALVLKGKALVEIGSLKDAVKILSHAADIAPKPSWVHQALGVALLRQGDFSRALDALDHAISLQPDDPESRRSRALALRAMDRVEEAASEFRLAWEQHPEDVWIPVELAKVLGEMRQPDEALQVLDDALRKKPEDIELVKAKVKLLGSLNRRLESMLVLQHTLDKAPDSIWALIALGQILFEMDFTDEALETVNRALRLEPQDTQAIAVQAKVYCATGRYREAIERLDEAIAIDPKKDILYGFRGWALENLAPIDAPAEARSYEQALALAPDYPWWHKGLANARRFMGDEPGAEGQYRWVLEWSRKQTERLDPALISLVGWCHYSLGEYDAAVDCIGQALSRDPTLASDQFDFALALLCRGSYVFALREYRKGLELTRSKPVSRRVGLLSVALRDRRFALERVPGLDRVSQAQEAVKALTDRLLEVEKIVAIDYQQSVEHSIDLNVNVDLAFFRLCQFEDYPKYARWVDEVEPIEGGRLRWCTTVGQSSFSWEVQILEQTPCARISWQSRPPGGHSCALTLFPTREGTRLRMRVSLNMKNKKNLNFLEAEGFLERSLKEALENFKQQVEKRGMPGSNPISPH